MRSAQIGIAVVMLGIGLAMSTVGSGKTASAHDSSRILSIGGDVTEILYALDLSDRVVAVDSTSQFPTSALKEKKNVGYLRALSPEGALSVAPTLILASEGAGPAASVRALKASSVPYVTVPEGITEGGIRDKINVIAEATGTEDKAKPLNEVLKKGFADLAKRRERIAKQSRVLFVLSSGGGRMIVGGADSSADAILRLAGARNAAASIQGFKPITNEALVSMNPDAIILMGGAQIGHSEEGLQQTPALKLSSAGRNGRIRIMDGLYLLGFGTRTPSAALDIMTWLYPELGSNQ